MVGAIKYVDEIEIFNGSERFISVYVNMGPHRNKVS